MTFSTSHILQLSILVSLATAIFFLAYRLPQVVSSTILLVMIPVQPIDTRYASANVFLTYVIFLAMLMKGATVRLPLLPQFLVLLFCYLLSMSFVHKALYVQHAVYMIAVVSAYMVLCIAYDLTLRFGNIRKIVNLLILMNLLVIAYSAVQVYVGPGVTVKLFGLQETAMLPARDDNRLTGPFAATGVTSEFFVVMIFLILHRLLLAPEARYRYLLMLLVCVNLGLLVATGNRGGFLTLIGGGGLFLWLFRRELGVRKVIQLAMGGSIALAFSAALIVMYTDFGVLFERLGETTVEEGIPDTRQQAWPEAWAHFKEAPLLGHGPRLVMDQGAKGAKYPGWEYLGYPHNLYLFLLSTIGVIGFVSFMLFFTTPLVRCWRLTRGRFLTGEEATFARLGVLLFIVILVDQIKVEFMRIALVDYWHFVFALLGVFAAVADRTRIQAPASDQVTGAHQRKLWAIPQTSQRNPYRP